MPYLSGPRRYFFHHSYRVLSLLNYPSLEGKTGGTRIEKYRHSYYATRSQVQRTTRTCSLVQPSCSALICSPPLRLVFRLRSHTYHLYVRSKQAVRYGRIKYQFFLVILSEVEGSSVAKNQTIAPDKFFISLRIYKIFMDCRAYFHFSI